MYVNKSTNHHLSGISLQHKSVILIIDPMPISSEQSHKKRYNPGVQNSY